MQVRTSMAGVCAALLLTGTAGFAATEPNAGSVPVQMVITARPGPGGSEPGNLDKDDFAVQVGNKPAPVLHLQRLAGDMATTQLFVLLDDSTSSLSLSVQLPELKSFLQSLPATTQVAVGYMHNGTFSLAQAFTQDHQKAADALRLPAALPGINASPYFVLSDLVKHWPSKQHTERRVVLMLTDGVDRYYDTQIIDDPYVDSAIQDALKQHVAVYSIYLRGAGSYGRGEWSTNVAQSRLEQVSQQTGGEAYFQGLTNPVAISPFLKDFESRLQNQYKVTVAAANEKGVRAVKLETGVPSLKIEAPNRVYVR